MGGAAEMEPSCRPLWRVEPQTRGLLTCACLVKTEATTVRVSPENPRVPRSHTLELRCASRCDPHLGPSLTLAWSKDGDALQTNGTEDGRWAGAGVGTGVPV